MRFNTLVNNYGKLYKLGVEIMTHPKILNNINNANLIKLEKKQHYNKVEAFKKLATQNSRHWNKYQESIKEYNYTSK